MRLIAVIFCLACLGYAVSHGAEPACTRLEGGETMKNDEQRVVRKALGVGRWFPGDPRRLQAMVKGYLDAAETPDIEGRIVSAIAPHAGYVYSGRVAGYTFEALRKNAESKGAPDVVVVLGFSHAGSFPGTALMDGDAFETPLGRVKLDAEAAEFLAAHGDSISFDYRPHSGEHSAENEIPFIQQAIPEAALVVALIGDHKDKTIDDLVSALNDLAERKSIVVVASTDMLHDPDYELVSKTDKATLKKIEKMDYKAISDGWDYSSQTLCGVCPVLAAMRFAEKQGCKKATTLEYRNSGDDFPDSRGSWVVGYGSVVFAVE